MPGNGPNAPQAVILPEPRKRFARTAARLDALSAGHTMGQWLQFMGGLSRAQHCIAEVLGPDESPDLAVLGQAAEGGLPPLAPERWAWRADWRDGLDLLLDAACDSAIPAPARRVAESLRQQAPERVDALADAFLGDGVDAADAGAALYVAAALQVQFTRRAASLPRSSVGLLAQRGLCPCCGSTAVAGVVAEAAPARGLRYLHCSLCSAAWNHVRAMCTNCGQSRSLALKEIEGGAGTVKAEVCEDCGTYAKLLFEARDPQVDPVADDLASLGLDILLYESGWWRHAPNPWLLG